MPQLNPAPTPPTPTSTEQQLYRKRNIATSENHVQSTLIKGNQNLDAHIRSQFIKDHTDQMITFTQSTTVVHKYETYHHWAIPGISSLCNCVDSTGPNMPITLKSTDFGHAASAAYFNMELLCLHDHECDPSVVKCGHEPGYATLVIYSVSATDLCDPYFTVQPYIFRKGEKVQITQCAEVKAQPLKYRSKMVFTRFILKKNLAEYLDDDTLIIGVDLKVFTPHSYTEDHHKSRSFVSDSDDQLVLATLRKPYEPALVHLGQLLEYPDPDNPPDAVIQCIDGEVYMHLSIVKARSDYFKQMSHFLEQTPKDNENTSNLMVFNHEDEGAECWQGVMYYLYTNYCPYLRENPSKAIDIFKLAHQYMLPELQAIAESVIIRVIPKDKALTAYLCSEVYESPILSQALINHLHRNRQIFTTPEWAEFSAKRPDAANSLMIKVLLKTPTPTYNTPTRLRDNLAPRWD